MVASIDEERKGNPPPGICWDESYPQAAKWNPYHQILPPALGNPTVYLASGALVYIVDHIFHSPKEQEKEVAGNFNFLI
jgi:hypothetical protein